MEVEIKKLILAAVALEEGLISGVPVFYAKNEDEQKTMALTLSRVLEAVAHEMSNGIYILVKH